MSKTKMYSRMMAVLLVIIFICGIAAHLVTTDGAKVKVERVALDARGAVEDAELYYPHGTNDTDSLPCVIVTHGAGVNGENMKNFATELSRRGFVVLNLTAYGAGLSEFPDNDEIGTGVENYNARATPGGLFDAINFVRTFKFVDQTRIGIVGHSQGSRRISYASALDCGYLTFNDIMINVLYDTFGQKFTEKEITQDADKLAEKLLNDDQLAFYNTLKEQNWEKYNTRVRATLVVGGDASLISPLQTVSVGGYEVQRNCQTNLGLVVGTFDSYTGYPSMDTTLASYYVDAPIELDTWYSLDDAGQQTAVRGNFFESDITSDAALKEAADSRTLRFMTMPVETHSRNMLSTDTTSAAVKFFEQMLEYNGGELSEGTGVAYDNMVFLWREIFSLIAMIAMLVLAIPTAGLILQAPFFADCVADNSTLPEAKVNKAKYWVFNIIFIIVGYIAIFKTNSIFAPELPYWKIYPITFNWWMAFLYLLWMAGASVILLVVFWLLDKKAGNTSGFKGLNIGFGFKKVLKSLLLAVIIVASAYMLNSVMIYFLGESFKFWTVEFTEIKAEQWGLVLTGAVLFLPEILLINLVTNYTLRKDLPAWKEDLICVLCSTIGIYLCWLVNYISLHQGNGATCNWNSSYGMLVVIPITTFITRKMYRVTKSVWLGSFVNALFISWTMVCINGYNTFFAQSVISNFLNK